MKVEMSNCFLWEYYVYVSFDLNLCFEDGSHAVFWEDLGMFYDH